MIELEAGGRDEADEAGAGLSRRRRIAGFGVLLAGFGLMTVPAAIGLLALWGIAR